jgi:plastocyanin
MTVSQKDKTFSSEDLKQTVGSTLRISNDDTVAHNVQMTTPSGETRNFGVQKPGESVEAPLEKAGDYAVRCGIHPRMKLSVHVQ